ncbi:hypothetical protein D3C75_1119690 [compost metagenome]
MTSAVLAAKARLALKRASAMPRRRSLTALLSSQPLMPAKASRVNSNHWVGVRVRPSRAGNITRQPMLRTSMASVNKRAGR